MKKIAIVKILMGCLLLMNITAMEAEAKKPDYRKVLNDFCRVYYEECFSDEFVENSIVVRDQTTISNDEIMVHGVHQYRDYNGKKHTEKFRARIETRNSEIQKITFEREHPADRTHTQPYWNGCSELFGEKGRIAQEKEEKEAERIYCKRLLERFCTSLYSKCFSGRSYLQNSLKITEVEENEDGGYTVKGKHAYKGRTGSVYNDMDFEADIQPVANGNRVRFRKLSSPDWTHSDYYWETGNGTIGY